MRLAVAVTAVAFALAAPGALAHPGIPPGIVKHIPKKTPGINLRARSLIEQGRRLFFGETFGGNGRTCGTCHAAESNFALSPDDVRRRPASDPLFVFEQRPELAGLENGPALRSKALILENLDGFDKPGVLRASPHLFGLALTSRPEAGSPVAARLGWGGDGSPGDGSLRNFAVGAVVQHFPRSLNRVEGVDFRLPTGPELNALEAFQLSLGRRVDPVVDPAVPGALVFLDPDVRAGQVLFHGMNSRLGTRRCSGCHTGGGAANDVTVLVAGVPVGENEQRANGNDVSPGATACHFPDAPGDGGFGATPELTVDRATFCNNGASGAVTLRGDRHFSVASAIEAADTLPAFHDNSAATIEAVVDFYRGDVFNASITGAGNGFVINDTQRNQVAAFVRALNVLENIRSSIAALDVRDGATARRDVNDAIKVLSQGALRPYARTALPILRRARAMLNARPTVARVLLTQARLQIAQ